MANKREQAVYVISVAAELAGVHPQTLRIYERRGLVQPALERLSLIQELTEEGLNLEGVKRVLELENLLETLRSKVDALQERVREAHENADKEIRQVHRSYRSEIVLRRQILPDVRRDRDK